MPIYLAAAKLHPVWHKAFSTGQRLKQCALSVHTKLASLAEEALQAQRLHLFGVVFDNLHSLQVLVVHSHLLLQSLFLVCLTCNACDKG